MSLQPVLLHPQVAARRVHLRHGINLSHWFSQVYVPAGYTPQHFDTYLTGEDLALIRSMGFDHVRFPIAPEPILQAVVGDMLPVGYLARLDRVVQTILDQGLRVIIDIHPEQAFKKQLAREDETVETFLHFWERFAAHFAKFVAGERHAVEASPCGRVGRQLLVSCSVPSGRTVDV